MRQREGRPVSRRTRPTSPTVVLRICQVEVQVRETKRGGQRDAPAVRRAAAAPASAALCEDRSSPKKVVPQRSARRRQLWSCGVCVCEGDCDASANAAQQGVAHEDAGGREGGRDDEREPHRRSDRRRVAPVGRADFGSPGGKGALRKAPLPPPSRSPVVDAPDQQYLVNAKVLAAGISATFACSSCRKSDSLVPDDVPPASQHHRTSGLGWGLTLRVRCRHCKARHTICLRGDRVAGQAPAEDVEENEQLDRAAKKARRSAVRPHPRRILEALRGATAQAHGLGHLPKAPPSSWGGASGVHGREHRVDAIPRRQARPEWRWRLSWTTCGLTPVVSTYRTVESSAMLD
eukprot:scaffold144712_cov30-Tisochrysis_lutea.AAC.2